MTGTLDTTTDLVAMAGTLDSFTDLSQKSEGLLIFLLTTIGNYRGS